MFDQISHCPSVWTEGLQLDPDAVWVYRDGTQFVAVLPRPNGGNLLLVTPAQWRHGWQDALQVWSDGYVKIEGQWVDAFDPVNFPVRGTCSL